MWLTVLQLFHGIDLCRRQFWYIYALGSVHWHRDDVNIFVILYLFVYLPRQSFSMEYLGNDVGSVHWQYTSGFRCTKYGGFVGCWVCSCVIGWMQ